MKSKIFAVIFMLVMLTSCSESIDANRFFTISFYETEVIPATTYLKRGEIAAVEFNAGAEFSGIEILAAKVDDDDTLTASLYEFKTDYETTLKEGKKIESATFRDYESRDTLMMSFKTEKAGKYLLTFSTKTNAGICVAAYPSEQAKNDVKFYLYDLEYTEGAYYAGIIFNGNRLNMDYFPADTAVVEPTPEVPEETPTEPENPEEIQDENTENPTESPEEIPEE